MTDTITRARAAAGVLSHEFGHSKLASAAVHVFMEDPRGIAEQLREITPPALLPLVVASMETHYHVCRTSGSGACDAKRGVALLKQYFGTELRGTK